jgi:LacI family transcriptional regulator
METPKRITLDAVATAAGVSKAAVSVLLNGRTTAETGGTGVGLSASTRKNIIEAARRLGYKPLNPESFLRLYPEQGHYCFLLSRTARQGFDQYFIEILRGLVDAIDGQSLNVHLAQFDPDVDYLAEPQKLPYALQGGVTNKFVFAGAPNYSLLMAVIERGHQAMYLSRVLDTRGVASAAPDYEQAGYLGVKHLIEMGHRRIALGAEYYFSLQTGLNYHTTRLLAGSRRALAEAGLPSGDAAEVLFSKEPSPDRHSTIVKELWSLPPEKRPTGVFCFCDYTASRLLRSAVEMGIRVPQELSVVGCNDQPVSREMSPALTTIHFPLRELGRMAVQHMGRVDSGEAVATSQYILPVSLLPRESVARPGPS